MPKSGKTIKVFEWETLRVDEDGFSRKHFDSLVKWQEGQQDTYFSVGYNKITFTQWVGVLQIGSIVIEILPKADPNRYEANSELRQEATDRWKNVLIEMLRKTGRLNLRTSEDTNLSVRHQNLFDLYFQCYLDKVETLIHRGLVKKYRIDQRNRTALKGKLLFQHQVALNTVHQERFFTEAAVYDRQNEWNEILLASLKISVRTAQSGLLRARAQNLVLNFPEWPDKKFTSCSFERLKFDRKTEGYRQAVTLARLIILQLNPQTVAGQNKVIAILFDMNRLWEEWLLATYRSSYHNERKVDILGKKRTLFWESEQKHNKILETDILVEDKREENERRIILDAKWKLPGNLPSDDELKQMFTYNLMWQSREAWLVYPKTANNTDLKGRFVYSDAGTTGMIFVDIFNNNRQLRRQIKLPNDAE